MPNEENPLFFYSIVQTFKDYVRYKGDAKRPGGGSRITRKTYHFARRWINGLIPKAQWGESDLEISFREALEMLGVAPENVCVIRDLLNKASTTPRKEQGELLNIIYQELHWHDEPTIYRRHSIRRGSYLSKSDLWG